MVLTVLFFMDKLLLPLEEVNCVEKLTWLNDWPVVGKRPGYCFSLSARIKPSLMNGERVMNKIWITCDSQLTIDYWTNNYKHPSFISKFYFLTTK
jgi:hypothetical protein